MSRKRRNYTPKPFESIGSKFTDYNSTLRADTSANIYESMLLSKAFMTLTNRQKVLYLYCKNEYYGHRKPKQDYKEIDALQSDDLFYLNWAAVKQYGIYSDTMHSNFYRDMKVLGEHGLIEKVSSGKTKHQKSIYRFSTKWHTWKA